MRVYLSACMYAYEDLIHRFMKRTQEQRTRQINRAKCKLKMHACVALRVCILTLKCNKILTTVSFKYIAKCCLT
jgi:hypothetical protein